MINEDDMDDDEESDDLPEFSVKDLSRLDNTKEGDSNREILIEERSVSNLAEIVAIANKDNRPICIEQCVLGETHIDAANIDISIEESVFTGKVEFKNGVFAGKIGFWDTTFEKKAEFGTATFRAGVSFEDCAFKNKVDFAGATFEQDASFISCDFEKEITFDRASFAGKVNFSESTFRKKVTYTEAFFWKEIDLTDAKFEEGLDTTGSNLEDMKEVVRQGQSGQQKKYQKKTKPRKSEFNPWRELDKVSRKNMSRRQILRGIFRFLPEKKND